MSDLNAEQQSFVQNMERFRGQDEALDKAIEIVTALLSRLDATERALARLGSVAETLILWEPHTKEHKLALGELAAALVSPGTPLTEGERSLPSLDAGVCAALKRPKGGAAGSSDTGKTQT